MNIKAFILKNWIWITISIVVLIILVSIYYKGKKAGKSDLPEIKDLPTDVAGQPLTTAEARQIREISTLLHDDLDGAPITGRDEETYRKFANLGDKLFSGVYDDFNTRFGKEGNGTLKEWINDDYFLLWSEEYNLKENIIMPRFARLGLV